MLPNKLLMAFKFTCSLAICNRHFCLCSALCSKNLFLSVFDSQPWAIGYLIYVRSCRLDIDIIVFCLPLHLSLFYVSYSFLAMGSQICWSCLHLFWTGAALGSLLARWSLIACLCHSFSLRLTSCLLIHYVDNNVKHVVPSFDRFWHRVSI